MTNNNPTKEGSIRTHNKNKILKAAEQEFAAHGFKGTTVQKIANCSGLPKTNILYYFKSKEGLYTAVLEGILDLWNSTFDKATAEDDPAQILAQYIAEKMEMSRTHPTASKIFAMEIINGAPNLHSFFKERHYDWMGSRIEVIEQWISMGKLAKLDPYHLLFNIWACSQHYADFSAQITQLKGKAMNQQDFKEATNSLVKLVLTGSGLAVPATYQ